MLKDLRNKYTKAVRLFYGALSEYKAQFLTLIFLGFFGGILEGVGINALIPLFSFFVEGGSGNDIISRAIKNVFLYLNIDFTVQYLLTFIVVLFFVKAIVLFLGNYIKIKIVAEYEKNTRKELFAHTINARWPYLIKQKIGHLEKSIMVEATNASSVLKMLSSMVMLFGSLFIYILIAINISLPITLITILFGVVLIFIFKPLVKRIRKTAQNTVQENRNTAHFVNENIIGAKTIKSMFVGHQIILIANKYFETLQKLKIRNFVLQNIAGIFFKPISLIFISVIFIFSYTTPGFNIASFAAVMYLIQRIFSDMKQLQTSGYRIHESVPYLESVMKRKQLAIDNKENVGSGKQFEFKNVLALRNVSFSYQSHKTILNKFNMEIKKGAFVGLIGASGEGKTTLVDLLLRLLEPTSGEIILDTTNISDINMKNWRKKVGYVSQDIYLVNDTIANNIKFYDSSITDEVVVASAKTAHIYNVIKEFPQGFETEVGERGMHLSAGQRQRIIIARVLARKPEILILDEATSALDGESEHQIQKAIENLKGKTTVLIIAHRLETVMNCDTLVVIKDGKIFEQGSPKTLFGNKESYFYKIYNIRK